MANILDTQKLYEDIWSRTGNIALFFEGLSKELKEGQVEEIIRDKEYHIIYSECGCDSHIRDKVAIPCLCECSRQSLLYSLNSMCLDQYIEIYLLHSILQGGSQCIIKILIKDR